MAKTVFADGDKSQGLPGTRVLAAFLNKIFSHRHDGLDADGSAPTNYAVAASEDGVTYTAGFTPALTAHIVGMPITVKFPVANTSATPTFTPDGGSGKQMQRKNGVPLNIGDIPAGHFAILVYNGSSYDLLNPYLPLNQSVTAEKATSLFGALDTAKVKNTVYQASTDLLVVAMMSDVDTAEMHGYVGAANPPTSEVAKEKTDGAGASMASITFPVRKGEFWKVSEVYGGTAPTITISVTPVGS